VFVSKTKKGGLAADRFAPAPGSFFDEKMLKQSCLMQDEPGREVCFSHKMSLEERVRMLGVDRQRANGTKSEPGADPGIFGGKR
jgi:hypothetical protein